ncbi:MAG: glycosyl hydrolase [Thermoguttaceae bacterium]
MRMPSALLAAAMLVGTVQVEFEGKTFVLSGGQSRVFGEEQPAAAAPTAKFGGGQVLPIGDFEQDLDGFQGAFQRDTTEAKLGKACAKLENKDKPWVEAAKDLVGLEQDFLELRFWAKARDAKTITMRLVDKAGHNYQQRFPIEPDGQWRLITVKEFNKGQSWGGPLDGTWRAPAKSITFVLEAKGTVWIDGVQALLDPRRVVQTFRVQSKVLGNVFLTGEPVEIPIETQAGRLECEVVDYWGKKVCDVVAVPKEHLAVLQPNIKARGHFTVRVRLKGRGDEAATAEREVDFAVVEPLDLAKLKASPFGAMTHFSVGWDTSIVPLIARAGIVTVRDEAFWAGVEEQKGVYNFRHYDRYLAELKKHGIQPLIVLTFANPHYDGGNTPYTAEGCRAYGRYAQEVLKHYGQQVRWLEVWNEYNGSFCAGPATQDRPRYYTQMCKTAYQHVKELRPEVTVLGAAAVSIPLPYFESVFQQRGMECMDAVVIHPYRGQPEGVEGEIAELRELVKKYNHGHEKPIWATEYGLGGLDPREPPRYLVRMSALMRSQNVERMYWYLMQDFNEFKGMGLIHDGQDPRGPYSPAPAYPAVAAMVRLLHDARFAEREASSKYTRTYVLKFLKGSGSDEVRVCWATHPGKIRVEADRSLTRVDLMGNSQSLKINSGAAVLDVDDTPFYLVGKAKKVIEVPTGTTIVADLVEDYAKTQGATNWYYGYTDEVGRNFKPFEIVVTPWGERWAGPLPYLGASRGSLHPQVKDGKAIWAVQRWKSPLRGKVQVKGHFERDRQGDGCTVLVLVNGKKIFEQHAGGPRSPTRREFTLDVEVKEGTLIDFAVTPGPDNNLDFDNTMVDAQVTLKE